MPFSLLPSILLLFSQQLSRLFIQGWTFLLLSCHFCSGPVVAIFILLLKTFHCDYRSPPLYFFAFFLVVILVIIFMPSCCSYCHCSTSSNSYTVVLSKPASHSPALFSVPIKKRTCLPIFYGCEWYGESKSFFGNCCKYIYVYINISPISICYP